MRRFFRLRRDAAKRVWFPVVVFVAAISLFGSLGFLTSASDDISAPSESPALATEAGDLQALPPAIGPDLLGGSGVEATDLVTYTAFVPLISTSNWQDPNAILGAQLFWNARYEEMAQKMAQMGAGWARLPFSWSYIERENTEPKNYLWPSTTEDWLIRLAESNIRVILTLTDNPEWAATWPGGPIDQPYVDNSELVEFLVAVVNRWGQPPYNVKYWEIYNEPDCINEWYAANGWGYFGPWPEAYAELLAAVYGPVKAADPEAQIVFGGMAYDWWDGSHFSETFLDDVLQAPGGDSFDLMNFHYYPSFRPNWEAYGPDILGKATYIQNKLGLYGLDRPVICTEANMWSDEFHGGSDELQSRYVAQLYARSMAADLEATIWFRLLDTDELGDWKYGLLNPDLSPKPSYWAYQTFAKQMALAEYKRTLSLIETGSEEIEAYQFDSPKSSRLIVAWTEDEQAHTMGVWAGQVVVVDKFGAENLIYDGDDGQADGFTQVTITPSPLYLRIP
jgi:hypothetical protein